MDGPFRSRPAGDHFLRATTVYVTLRVEGFRRHRRRHHERFGAHGRCVDETPVGDLVRSPLAPGREAAEAGILGEGDPGRDIRAVGIHRVHSTWPRMPATGVTQRWDADAIAIRRPGCLGHVDVTGRDVQFEIRQPHLLRTRPRSSPDSGGPGAVALERNPVSLGRPRRVEVGASSVVSRTTSVPSAFTSRFRRSGQLAACPQGRAGCSRRRGRWLSATSHNEGCPRPRPSDPGLSDGLVRLVRPVPWTLTT